MENNIHPEVPVQIELDITEEGTTNQSKSKIVPHTEWTQEDVLADLEESRETGGAWGDLGGNSVSSKSDKE